MAVLHWESSTAKQLKLVPETHSPHKFLRLGASVIWCGLHKWLQGLSEESLWAAEVNIGLILSSRGLCPKKATRIGTSDFCWLVILERLESTTQSPTAIDAVPTIAFLATLSLLGRIYKVLGAGYE